MRADYHVHTSYRDGKAAPAEMAAAAYARGLEALGFSGHAHTLFDESWCMSPAGTAAYRREVEALKREYAGRMTVLLGVEQDLYSDAATEGYDYVIGSAHYLRVGGEYLPVDESPAHVAAAAEKHFGGDVLAFAEA